MSCDLNTARETLEDDFSELETILVHLKDVKPAFKHYDRLATDALNDAHEKIDSARDIIGTLLEREDW
jgi:hypothetical protein